MIVLDTNVISALMHNPIDPLVLAWLNTLSTSSVWTTSITMLEIRYGLEQLAVGRRREDLSKRFEHCASAVLDGRILAFGADEAAHAAVLMGRRRSLGRPVGRNADMIAGIVKVHRATLATRNIKHFADAGIDLVNPWGG